MNGINPRDPAVHQLSNGRTKFAERNIKFPKDVDNAFALFERVEAQTPKKPSQTAIREAILSGAPSDEIDRLLLADLGAERLRSEHNKARADAALLTLAAVRAAHDYIYPQLKALADKAITHLEAVAQMERTRLEDLVRDSRYEEAQLLVTAEDNAIELNELWTLRDTYLFDRNDAAAKMLDCSRWRDPRIPNDASPGDETFAQAFVNGLRNGGVLWFPTQAEALAAAKAIATKAEHKTADEVPASEPAPMKVATGWFPSAFGTPRG